MNSDWYHTPQYKAILDEIQEQILFIREALELGLENIGDYHLNVGRIQALKGIKDYLEREREQS